MPIQLVWDEDKNTTLRFIYAGKWTWDELHVSVSDAQRRIEATQQTIHLIIDLTDSRLIPSGSFTGHIRGASSRMPENTGLVIIVGNSLMLKVIQKVMSVIPGRETKKGFVLSTLDEARNLIAAVDARR
jgi:hypothetical protein